MIQFKLSLRDTKVFVQEAKITLRLTVFPMFPIRELATKSGNHRILFPKAILELGTRKLQVCVDGF